MAFQAQHRVVITTIFQNLGISTIFVAAFDYLWYEQPEILNAVTAAQRTAMLTSFVLMVVNMLVALRYAQMWKSNLFCTANDHNLCTSVYSVAGQR